jgi:hypothetical protein
MKPARILGIASLCAHARPAGNIDSSSGSESAVPAPLISVRRDRYFPVRKRIIQ